MYEFVILDKEKLYDLYLDELDELGDSEDEAILANYRRKHMAELRALAEKSKYGSVRDFSCQDYIDEVNKAGEDIWVVLHFYKQGISLCALINELMSVLSIRLRNSSNQLHRRVLYTKFPRKESADYIHLLWRANEETIHWTAVELRDEKLTIEQFEYLSGQYDAIQRDTKKDPRQQVKDKLFFDLADTNDWWFDQASVIGSFFFSLSGICKPFQFFNFHPSFKLFNVKKILYFYFLLLILVPKKSFLAYTQCQNNSIRCQ